MNDLALTVREFREKALAARTDVASIDQLRLEAIPADGTSFRIGVMPYMWVAGDRTPDDGASSVKPANLPSSAPGRYRRIMFRMPLAKS